ncbi:hypothetical protein [Singulisphaera sp. GP187]|uniref:hypothetical protein n=1 Tax=Singulisphaera sp. GP187 TaxID=1882752 RepID=UPI000940DC82|nr:hypothetical protein [Singulisphaera sp. GP187]
MVQHDMKAAGIPDEVNGRFADFHALRKTFVTDLARSGVMSKVALARYSDINLTLGVYTGLEKEDLHEAIGRLDAIINREIDPHSWRAAQPRIAGDNSL